MNLRDGRNNDMPAGAASPDWWRNVNLQAELPRWWYVLDAMADGRWWTTAVLKRRLAWMPAGTVTSAALLLWKRGHIKRRTNPRYLVGVPWYAQPPGLCPHLLRITAAGRVAHADAEGAAARLADGAGAELLPIGAG